MEYLDYYDEDWNYLGYKSRDEVHKEGLWHNTVHCWLYEKDGSIYFQIRSDSHKFYTTASGHVLKGETIKEAFRREIKEEIGLDIDSSDATLVNIDVWKMDKLKNAVLIKDRAKANIYIDLFEGNINRITKRTIHKLYNYERKINAYLRLIIIKEHVIIQVCFE